MKELPQTLLLRPTGFNTMAVDVWSFASEGLFTQAAFSAFILLIGRLGTTELAASNVALNISMISFMPMIGFLLAALSSSAIKW